MSLQQNQADEVSPLDMAHETIANRIQSYFTRLVGTQPVNDSHKKLAGRMMDEAKAVFEDAVKRLGEKQAIEDATSGAVGLPLEPRARQAEIERRRREIDAQHTMQMGHGEQYAILEGRMQTGLHEQVADFTRPELSPNARPGNGERINRQIEMVRQGMIDPSTGETFDRPQERLFSRDRPNVEQGEREIPAGEAQQKRELLARTRELRDARR